MKKLTGFVLLFLLLIVIGLSVAVVNLYQNPRMMNETDTSSLPSSSASVVHEENSGRDASSKNESHSENGQEESEVVSLQCSVQLGVLNIVEGDEFHVSESNGSDYEMYIEDGVYIIKGSATRENHIVVTVPEDFLFQSVELTVTGGALTAQDIHAQTLLTNCDKGTLHFSGLVDGDIQAQHLQGKTILNMEGKESDFNYQLDYSLGHIGIGTQQYAGADGSQSIDNGAGKSMDIDCAMGSVSVLFAE